MRQHYGAFEKIIKSAVLVPLGTLSGSPVLKLNANKNKTELGC